MGRRAKSKNGNFVFRNCKGVEYEVIFRKPDKRIFGEECDGICEDPEEKHPKICINPYNTKQTELNTCIHEFAHAFFWDKSEREQFEEAGVDLAKYDEAKALLDTYADDFDFYKSLLNYKDTSC